MLFRSEAGGEALHALVGKRTAAADAIADAVVEGADAKTVEVDLVGVGTDGVAHRVAEVEALSIDVNLRAIHAIAQRGQGVQSGEDVLHVVEEVEAHDVEAEAVDLVLARVEHEGIDHQLLHHAVLAGGVWTAGASEKVSVRIEAMVVVRYDLVEVGVGRFPCGAGVVEDDILDDAQAGAVQALDHGAVFARDCRG